MDAVEQTHSLRLAQSSLIADSCQEEMTKIQHPPPGWSVEADEELARFMVQHGGQGISSSGVGNEYLKRVEASSGEVRLANECENSYECEESFVGYNTSYYNEIILL